MFAEVNIRIFIRIYLNNCKTKQKKSAFTSYLLHKMAWGSSLAK